MDERRASASIVGRVHSRATPISVNPPGNGAIRREEENRPICHSFPTGTLLHNMAIDFVLRIWQVDLIVAPFRVLFFLNCHEVGSPCICQLYPRSDGICRGSATSNV